MRIKVVGSGVDPIHDWRVVDAETGDTLVGVERVEIEVDVTEGIRAVIYMHAHVELEIETEAEVVEHERPDL